MTLACDSPHTRPGLTEQGHAKHYCLTQVACDVTARDPIAGAILSKLLNMSERTASSQPALSKSEKPPIFCKWSQKRKV